MTRIGNAGGFLYNSSFKASLYNGSEWDVSEIEYRISATPPDALD